MGAFVAAVLVPAGASAKVTIKDNGWKSKNAVVKLEAKVEKVKQRSNTNANTTVFVDSNTGWNEANHNTGGDTNTETGVSRVTTTVEVTGGTNENTGGEGCCCGEGDENLVIKDNGAFSHNGIFVGTFCADVVKQSNSTSSNTFVGVHSNTGGNEANGNTNGTTTTTTGNSTVTTTVTVTGGDNINN